MIGRSYPVWGHVNISITLLDMIGRSYPVWGHVNISITLLDMIGRSKTNEMSERIHSMT